MVTMRHRGYALKAHLLTLSGKKTKDAFILDHPVAVQMYHRLVRYEGKEMIDGDVWTEFMVYEVWENCLYGDCERPVHTKPWWAIKKWKVVE
jgi:hypothetical protein